MIKVVSFLIVFACSFLNINTINDSNIRQESLQSSSNVSRVLKATDSSNIVDGGVYVIMPYLNLNKAIDIPYGDCYEGAAPTLYDEHWAVNQRFVLEKSYNYDNSHYYYRMRALDSIDLYLSIFGDNAIGKFLALKKDTKYTKENMKKDRFHFVYDASSDSYLISTYESNNTDYLHVENNNTQNGSRVCASPITSTDCFRWKLFLTDSLHENVKRDVLINPGNQVTFNVRQKAPLKYVFSIGFQTDGLINVVLKTNDYQTVLLNYTFNRNSDDVESFSYNLTRNNYRLMITNLSSTVFQGSICINAYQKATFATMFDYGRNNMDSVSAIVNHYDDIVSSGYYPSVKVNMGSEGCFEQMASGKTFANSDMFFAIAHGNPGGVHFYNGVDEEGGWVDLNNMMSFSGTSLTYWGSCDSDIVSTNHNGLGVTSTVARRAVEKGAEYSMGFRGLVLSEVARDIPRRFFAKFKYDGKTIHECLEEVMNDFNNDVRIRLCSIFASGTLNATLYVKKATGIKKYDLVTKKELTDNKKILNSSLSPINKGSYFEFNGNKYLVIDGIPTNLDYKLGKIAERKIRQTIESIKENNPNNRIDLILKEQNTIYYLEYDNDKNVYNDLINKSVFVLNLDKGDDYGK